jgi:hypothetical protein
MNHEEAASVLRLSRIPGNPGWSDSLSSADLRLVAYFRSGLVQLATLRERRRRRALHNSASAALLPHGPAMLIGRLEHRTCFRSTTGSVANRLPNAYLSMNLSHHLGTGQGDEVRAWFW